MKYLLILPLCICLLGCAGKPSKKIGAVVDQYDALADAFALPMKNGMDKVGDGDMKGAVGDLETCMKEMARVSQISIEGCPDDFIMAWATFASKHDEARQAIGKFVVSTKNVSNDDDDPIAGLAKLVLGGGLSAALQLQQVGEGLQSEASKLKIVCSKYGVDGSAFDVMTRIDKTEKAIP